MRRHILPNTLTPVLVAATLNLGLAILAEAATYPILSQITGTGWLLFAYLALAIGCGLSTSFEMLLVLRFIHGLVSAALGVVVVAVIRDLFAGDAMAKRLSLIFLVFMIVPIIAPTIGAGVEAVAGWRAIFIVLAIGKG